MDTQKMIQEVKKNQQTLGNWGFFDHVSKISCRPCGSQYWFYNSDNVRISRAKAEALLVGTNKY